MYKADRVGFLSISNMAKILTYCETHGKDDKIPFSDEDLERFAKVCPQDYRENLSAPDAPEECLVEVVEIEESPVESIEE